MSLTTVDEIHGMLGRLRTHSRIEYIDQNQRTVEDRKLDEFDQIYWNQDVDAYLGITARENVWNWRYRISSEQVRQTVEVDTPAQLRQYLSAAIDILTSKYLHRPDVESGVLIGFLEEKSEVCVLHSDGRIAYIDAHEANPSVMHGYDVRPCGIEFGNLKAVADRSMSGKWISRDYVFKEGVIFVFVWKDRENEVMPFVYDTAYLDFLGNRVQDAEILYLAEDMVPKLTGRLI